VTHDPERIETKTVLREGQPVISPLVVPLIETPRLRLREHRPTDHDAASAMWADPAVVRFIGGRAFTPEEVWQRLLRYAGLWAWFGFGYWAIEERDSGAFIGDIGFADFRRAIDPPLVDTPEFGFALVASAHGKGYATEAAAAVLTWADDKLQAARTACLIAPVHGASLAVARKSGFAPWRELTWRGLPALLLARERGGFP
jgi:RimJ/RimL family protein N-acetyltransferase